MELRTAAALLGLLLFGPAAGGLLWLFVRALLSRGWREVPGVITESTLERPARKSLQGQATVRYRYALDGAERTGERIRFGDWMNYSVVAAGNSVRRYPAGRSVTVRVNPRAPGDATLESAVPWVLFVWLFLLALGLGVVISVLAGAA